MPLHCSAGSNHFLLYPNGDIYRCMASYNMKNSPTGNILNDGLRINEQLEVCDIPKCYAICDIDWTNKWILDDSGSVVKKICAKIAEYKPLDAIPQRLKLQEFSHQFRSDIVHIVWVPTLFCNYDCIYCGCAVGAKSIYRDFPSSGPELSVDEWSRVFKEKILAEFEWLDIDITGGEPFLSKTLVPILKLVEKNVHIKITTNADFDIIDVIRRNMLKAYNTKKNKYISFNLSCHPLVEKADIESFICKAIYLNKNEFLVGVNIVAHPKQLHLIDYYRNIFAKERITFRVLPWCGQDNDGKEGYSSKELKFVQARTTIPIQLDIVNLINKGSSNHKIEIVDFPKKTSLSTPLIARLKINSAYLSSLRKTSKDSDNILLGCRIFRLGETGDRVKSKELRQGLPDLDYAIEFETDFLVDLKGLKTGRYELKFDIVNENKFWFEDIGFKPAEVKINATYFYYKANISVKGHKELCVKSGSDYVFKINIKNTGNIPWIEENGDSFKVGCRLVDREGKTKSEYRAELPPIINPREEFIGEMSINIPPVTEGTYKLKFDIVNENNFWLEDLGSFPLVLPIEITDSH